MVQCILQTQHIQDSLHKYHVSIILHQYYVSIILQHTEPEAQRIKSKTSRNVGRIKHVDCCSIFIDHLTTGFLFQTSRLVFFTLRFLSSIFTLKEFDNFTEGPSFSSIPQIYGSWATFTEQIDGFFFPF